MSFNLLRYNNFKDDALLIESVQRAKKFLRDTYLHDKAAKELSLFDKEEGKIKSSLLPEEAESLRNKIREIKLSDEEIRTIERNADYIKIRDMLTANQGWTYTFVYFYFVEHVPIDELKATYEKLLEFRDLISRMPKQLDDNFIDTSIDNNYEKLIDGLENLVGYRKYKKFVDQLPGNLRRSITDAMKPRVEGIAVSFDELGKDTDTGKIDIASRDSLQKVFFSKVRRYSNIVQLMDAAESYLKSANNENISNFYKSIEKVNTKFGASGVDIVYDEHNILILDIKSFVANKALNSNTSHCIASSSGMWDSYVDGSSSSYGDNPRFNKQYYIYNFNLAPSDNKSIIGITIEPKQKIKACHLKNDAGFASNITSQLKAWEKEYKIKDDLFSELKPMTDEEIELRKRRIKANKEIVKPGLTLDQIKGYIVNDNADPNASDGKPLEHAIVDGDITKAKFLIEYGASPNIKSGQDALINKAKDLEMVKFLLSKGAEMTGDVFGNMLKNSEGAKLIESVKFCLDAGMDPNFTQSFPVRKACEYGNMELLKLLVEGGARLDLERDLALKWASEYGRIDIIDYMFEKGIKSGYLAAKNWAALSTKLKKKDENGKMVTDKEAINKTLYHLQKYIDSGKVEVRPDEVDKKKK